MADLVQRVLACLAEYEVHDCRQVLGAHVLPVELPELVHVRVEADVLIAEPRAPVVDQPHVLVPLRQDERGRLLGLVANPEHHVDFDAVHHQDGPFVRVGLVAGLRVGRTGTGRVDFGVAAEGCRAGPSAWIALRIVQVVAQRPWNAEQTQDLPIDSGDLLLFDGVALCVC